MLGVALKVPNMPNQLRGLCVRRQGLAVGLQPTPGIFHTASYSIAVEARLFVLSQWFRAVERSKVCDILEAAVGPEHSHAACPKRRRIAVHVSHIEGIGVMDPIGDTHIRQQQDQR
jgi:hypothetical protein